MRYFLPVDPPIFRASPLTLSTFELLKVAPEAWIMVWAEIGLEAVMVALLVGAIKDWLEDKERVRI